MQAQDTATPSDQDKRRDVAVLGVLLDSRHPLAVEEVAREVSDEIDAVDSLARLVAAGLVHRLDGFVFPTRACARAGELASL